MIDTVPRSAVGRLVVTRGAQAWLRAIVLTMPVVAFSGTSAAAGSAPPLVGLVVFGLAVACTLAPESHLGLLIVAIVGIHWLIAVDDVTSRWSLVVGLSLGALHLSMAAASVAPPAARWTPAMTRRWSRRAASASAVTTVVFVAVFVLGDARFDGTTAVLIVALAALSLAGLWMRGVAIGRRDS